MNHVAADSQRLAWMPQVRATILGDHPGDFGGARLQPRRPEPASMAALVAEGFLAGIGRNTRTNPILCVLFFTAALAAQSNAAPPPPAGQFRISGRVLHALTGEPMARARVMILSTTTRDVEQAQTADENGRFTFIGLASGKYSLEAEYRDFPQQALDAYEQYSTAIAVGPEKDSEHILFRLRPDSSITGRVTDEMGEPVRVGEVWLFTENTPTGGKASSPQGMANLDDRGEFRLPHLAPGSYKLAVSSRPWYARYEKPPDPPATDVGEGEAELDVAFPITYFPEGDSPENARSIVLGPGDRFIADMTLRPVPALHLRIVNLPEGQKTVRVDASPMWPGGAGSYQSTVNSEGNTVEINGLAPGQYDIQLISMEKNDAAPTRYLTVSARSSGDLDVAGAVAYAPVAGVVQFEGATSPPKSASILVNKASQRRRWSWPISATGA